MAFLQFPTLPHVNILQRGARGNISLQNHIWQCQTACFTCSDYIGTCEVGINKEDPILLGNQKGK